MDNLFIALGLLLVFIFFFLALLGVILIKQNKRRNRKLAEIQSYWRNGKK